MDDLEQYLDVLFDGLEGYVYSPVKTPTDWVQKFFEYPREKDLLIQWIKVSPGDIYISPAVYSQRDATKKSIKNLQVAWVEFDGAEKIDYRNLPIPTAQVQTSLSTHLHSYWRLNETTHWAAVEDLNRRLTHYLEADSSGWDATQLLRPPGTTNYKRNLPVRLVSLDSSYFGFEHFDSVPPVRYEPNFITEVGELKSAFEIITQHSLPNSVLRMIKSETPHEGHRSSFLAKLASELAEEGLLHREIVSLLYETDERVGKYKGRTDQLVRLSQLADYALHKLVVIESVPVYSVEEILRNTEDLKWILPPWLHSTGQLIISSAPGVGKTQIAFQLAYSILESIRFLGMKSETSTTHSILFMSLEMDKRSLKYILSRQQNEWKNKASPTRLHVLDESTTLTMYENLIEERQITVLIVDSLTELFDETADNSNAEARRVMKWCRKIRRRYGLAVILIHHNRKATEGNKKPKGLADLAGSFQFAKDSDTVIQLWEDHRGLELSTPKVRYGQKTEYYLERNEHLWFRRKDGKDTDGDESVQPDPEGTSTVKDNRSGHRNDVDKSLPPEESPGFSVNFGL